MSADRVTRSRRRLRLDARRVLLLGTLGALWVWLAVGFVLLSD